MGLNRANRGTSTPGEQAITIKHGNAPEIQAVNISVKKKRAGKRSFGRFPSTIEAISKVQL